MNSSTSKKNLGPIEIGGMLVSSVEYTLDLFCNRPTEVENLLMMMRRSLYIPYQKSARIIGEHTSKWGDPSRMNSVYHLRLNKLYERGDDNTKTKEGWRFHDLNRVRLEHTAKRRELRKHGISSITDLIQDCRFNEINK